MISINTRAYDFYLYETANAYGQAQLSAEKKGQIKMSIFDLNKNTQDNIKYQNATFLGLTFENITDRYVIQYGETKLKVLYVMPRGRHKQVFMCEM